jgi:diguanylate cyclase (GGDEF)-like protein/PAS domain S-box-containing protein
MKNPLRSRLPLRNFACDWSCKLTLGLGVFVFLYLIWTYFEWGGEKYKPLIAYLGFLPLGIISFIIILRVSFLPALDKRSRWAWRTIAVVVFLRAIGNWVGFYTDVILGATSNTDWSEIPYMLYYPVLLCGVLMFPMKQKGGKTWLTFGLDAASVMLGTGMVIWYFLLQPIVAAPYRNHWGLIVALSYPIGDLALIFAITVVLLRNPEDKVSSPLNILIVSLIINTFADLAFGYLMLQNAYTGGGLVDALFIISFYLMTVSGQYQYWQTKYQTPSQVLPKSPNKILVWLPYSGIFLGYGLLLGISFNEWDAQDSQPLHILIYCAIGLTGLIVARQIIALRDNAKLLAEQAERRNELRFSSLVQNSSDVIIITDVDMTMKFVSPAVERVFGYRPDALVGTSLRDLLHADDLQHAISFFTEAISCLGITALVEWRIKHHDGYWIHVESIGNNLISDSTVQGIVINSRNVTERKVLEEQLTHQAFHDPLTGLANRALFRDRVEQALMRGQREHQPITVMFLDLDNFKTINDSLGHTEGDLLLATVANRLRDCLRSGDTSARLGGDEFAILLEDCTDASAAIDIAERILEVLESPVLLQGKEVFVSVSIGISVSSTPEGNVDVLLRNADTAMYRAKSCGKGRYELFEPSMHEAVLNRLEIEAALRQAIERQEFALVYQPIIEFKTGQMVGIEALIRWHSETHGIIPPNTFIPLAEETGLIVPIGKWVLEQACSQAKRWHELFPAASPLTITVNLSGRQLHEHDFAETLAKALRHSGLPPQSLILEITESMMMHDTELMLSKLNQLKAMEVKLAIDDFGIGYSSLSYLQRFPVDILKIDRSFVEVMNKGTDESALVQAIITLGQTLRLKIIAEGIEHLEQMEILQTLGCEWGQGFHFSEPITSHQVENFLRNQSLIPLVTPLSLYKVHHKIPLSPFYQ